MSVTAQQILQFFLPFRKRLVPFELSLELRQDDLGKLALSCVESGGSVAQVAAVAQPGG